MDRVYHLRDGEEEVRDLRRRMNSHSKLKPGVEIMLNCPDNVKCESSIVNNWEGSDHKQLARPDGIDHMNHLWKGAGRHQGKHWAVQLMHSARNHSKAVGSV